jgi:uncharacterized membrane protein
VTADEYLARLDSELRRMRAAHRGRILSEVRDHLLEAGPDGPERLGDPGELAATFAVASASATVSTASRTVAAVVVITLGLWAAIALDVRSHPWLNDFPGALVAALSVQVAAVAAFVVVVRTVRYRGRVPGHALPLLARANAVAAASVSIGLAVTALAEAQHLQPARAGIWEIAVAGTLAAVCALTLVAAGASAHAVRRARAFSADAQDDVVADILALVPSHLAGPAGRASAFPWLDLRGHPWRVCATLSAVVFVAIAVAGFVRGEPSPAVGVVEALGIFAGFAVFGRLLGLRR